MNNLAQDYYNYMKYRNKTLGLYGGLELSLDFYKKALKNDNHFIFGIYNDGKNMTRDIHFPSLFKKWMDNQKKIEK